MAKVTGSSNMKPMGGSKPGAGRVFGTAGGTKVPIAGKPIGGGASYKGGHKDSVARKMPC